MKTIWKALLPSFVLACCAFSVHAQTVSESEKQAYCVYIEDQAKAEKTLDTGVQFYGRVGQSDTSSDNTTNAVIGAQKSLSKHLQGRSATRVASLECDLYRETLDVDRATKFAFLAVTQRVGAERSQALTDVLRIVDEEIAATRRRRKSGNGTLEDLLSLTERREAVFALFILAQTDAAQAVPDWHPVNLKQAMDHIDGTTRSIEVELNHKQALQTWDVALVGGFLKPIDGSPVYMSTKTQRFVALSVTYNFNARAYGRQLDETSTALLALRHQQNDDLFQRVVVLEKTVAQNLAIDQESLPTLVDDADRLGVEYAKIKKIDSPVALRIRAKLRIGLALATVELRMARLRISLLSQYHA